jgi:hypothetical protein
VFRPTQTAPTILTAFNIVVGFLLAIALVVMALLNTAESGVLAEIRADSSQDSGLLFLTAAFTFAAVLRPLVGGVMLLIMGVIVLGAMPVIGTIALVFAVLSLLRAFLSRRHLAAKK